MQSGPSLPGIFVSTETWTLSSQNTRLQHCIKFAENFREKNKTKHKTKTNRKSHHRCTSPATHQDKRQNFKKSSYCRHWKAELKPALVLRPGLFFSLLISAKTIQLFALSQHNSAHLLGRLRWQMFIHLRVWAAIFSEETPRDYQYSCSLKKYSSVFSPSFRVRKERSNNHPKFWIPTGE